MKRFILAALPLILAACYSGGPDYVDDIDVVYTTYDDKFDFAGKNTYAMPDKIVVDAEKDDNGNWIPEYMTQAIADPILDYIELNMAAKGWTRLPNMVDGSPDENADVVLTPAALKSNAYFYSYWYDWWYGAYWGGYWGWYYPPYFTDSTYTTGSIILVMADPNIGSPINESQASWIAVANGLFTGNYNFNRVKAGIDQAFAQSPYLKTN